MARYKVTLQQQWIQGINWRGGGAYSYIQVLPDSFLLKSTLFKQLVKWNQEISQMEPEYTNMNPPPINALDSSLHCNENDHLVHGDTGIMFDLLMVLVHTNLTLYNFCSYQILMQNESIILL